MSESNLLKYQKTQERLATVSPSFCLAKWLQVTLHLYLGTTQSCHHVQTHRVDLSTLDADPSGLHNTPKKAAARAQMLAGERPKECSYCWKVEDVGRFSDRVEKSSRHWAAPYFDEAVRAGAQNPIRPRSVELAFDSACNFKCMYCGPSFSTRWMEEIKSFGPYPLGFNDLESRGGSGRPLPEEERLSYIEHFWRWWPELAEDLRVLRVTGGEPLLSPDTFRLMSWLAENPRPGLQFAVNTNMSMRKAVREKFIAHMNALQGCVREFGIHTSVDTADSRKAEYIRFGLSFTDFEENVEDILARAEFPILLSYMVTVNALSLVGLEELMRKIHAQRLRHPKHHIGVDTPYLQYPRHLSVEILPRSFARYLERTVEFMRSVEGTPGAFTSIEIEKVERIRVLILNRSLDKAELRRLRQDFHVLVRENDRRRKLDFWSAFPEYRGFWLLCKFLDILNVSRWMAVPQKVSASLK